MLAVDDFSNLTIIIPTLNEAENILKLMRLLIKRYDGVSIIVADDGSTDGTVRTVNEFSKGHGRKIILLDRKNRKVHGLTASVLDGALIARTKKIIVMDADMQHPFEKVGNLAKALDACEIAIGVRSTVKDWGLARRAVSKCMSLFVYSVFAVRKLNTCDDMMSGFFGVRTSMLKSLIKRHKASFVPEGYKVLLDLLRIAPKGVSIREVRYNTFHLRQHGESKLAMLGIGQAANTLRSTFR